METKPAQPVENLRPCPHCGYCPTCGSASWRAHWISPTAFPWYHFAPYVTFTVSSAETKEEPWLVSSTSAR